MPGQMNACGAVVDSNQGFSKAMQQYRKLPFA